MKLFAILLTAIITIMNAQAANTTEGGSVQNIPLKTLSGEKTSLADYKGKVVLLVNVASKCGLTPQYEALQALQDKYAAKGFTVVGVPCNDFGAQEPGTSEEIQKFCKTNYKVSFPLMEKLHVKGPEQHPLYARLTNPKAEFPGEIQWNFGKFLISPEGKVLKRFEPRTTPDSPEVVGAIEQALAAK